MSIICAASKLIERIAHQLVYDYVVKNDLLNKAQFGFRPGHSTGAALGSIIDDWLQYFDLGRIIGALYLDLKRAFDTVNPSLMLFKVKMKGVSDFSTKVV